jgi:hypothetical protein
MVCSHDKSLYFSLAACFFAMAQDKPGNNMIDADPCLAPANVHTITAPSTTSSFAVATSRAFVMLAAPTVAPAAILVLSYRCDQHELFTHDPFGFSFGPLTLCSQRFSNSPNNDCGVVAGRLPNACLALLDVSLSHTLLYFFNTTLTRAPFILHFSCHFIG